MGNPRSDLAPGEATAVNTIAYVLGSLSFLGSAFIVACFLAFKSRRTFGFRLVFLLSLNDAASQFRIIVQGLKVALGDGSPWVRRPPARGHSSAVATLRLPAARLTPPRPSMRPYARCRAT